MVMPMTRSQIAELPDGGAAKARKPRKGVARRFKVPATTKVKYAVACRPANSAEAHIVSRFSGYNRLTFDAAVRLLWRIEKQYADIPYRLRYSPQGDAFVVEYRGRFHASYAIVEVEAK